MNINNITDKGLLRTLKDAAKDKLDDLNKATKARTYRQHEIDYMDDRALRKAYTKQRKEALRRLSILKREGVLDYIDNVPDITQARGRSYEYVKEELTEINLFLKNPFSKITYVKNFERYMVATLRYNGYYNINMNNIREFNQYMQYVKESSKDDMESYYDPNRTVEIFDEAKRLNLDYNPEELWNHHEELKLKLTAISELKPVKNNKPMTQKELRTRITKWINKQH